jgi:hypothetical protein
MSLPFRGRLPVFGLALLALGVAAPTHADAASSIRIAGHAVAPPLASGGCVIETTLDQAVADISSLETSVSGLSTSVTTLQGAVATLQGTVSTLPAT